MGKIKVASLSARLLPRNSKIKQIFDENNLVDQFYFANVIAMINLRLFGFFVPILRAEQLLKD